MIWNKRVGGIDYKSPLGIGSNLGNMTQKIIGFQVKCHHLSICVNTKMKDAIPNKHQWYINHPGSPKLMEAIYI